MFGFGRKKHRKKIKKTRANRKARRYMLLHPMKTRRARAYARDAVRKGWI